MGPVKPPAATCAVYLASGSRRLADLPLRSDLLVLTGSEEVAKEARERGYATAAPTLKYSLTDPKSKRFYLGGLLVAWRLRRLLYNEGIRWVIAPAKISSLPVAVAALMVGAKFTVWRDATIIPD